MGTSYSTPVDETKDKFIKKLDSLGHNGNAICELLIHDKCVIAGSFALQVLIDFNFADSDIDIFTFNDEPIKKYLLANDYKIKVDTQNIEYKKKLGYEQKITHIKNVTTYIGSSSKVPIQVILINERPSEENLQYYCDIHKITQKSKDTCDECIKSGNMNPLKLVSEKIENNSMNEYIENNFDLDICKIIFDGTNINKYDHDSIKNKKCVFSISKKPMNDAQYHATWDRIKKYTERGYNFEITK